MTTCYGCVAVPLQNNSIALEIRQNFTISSPRGVCLSAINITCFLPRVAQSLITLCGELPTRVAGDIACCCRLSAASLLNCRLIQFKRSRWGKLHAQKRLVSFTDRALTFGARPEQIPRGLFVSVMMIVRCQCCPCVANQNIHPSVPPLPVLGSHVVADRAC